jgi:hypothetical protein
MSLYEQGFNSLLPQILNDLKNAEDKLLRELSCSPHNSDLAASLNNLREVIHRLQSVTY